MASERIEKLLAMQQKAEAQKRKAEQQLKAAKQPLPVRGAHLYASSMRRAFSESPDDYSLSDVITAYLDMRKDGRETWSRYAQEKGAVHDLKDGFKAVSFLSNHELYTVGQLGQYTTETKQEFSKIKAESTAKERRIQDIDALFNAIQTVKELKPIQQEYESIH